MTIFEEKKALRLSIKQILKDKYSDEKVRFFYSRKTSEKLIEEKAFKEAEYVFMYIPKSPELDDMFVEYTAHNLNKKICVPRVLSPDESGGKESWMEFYFLDKSIYLANQLTEGAFGILEPARDRPAADLASGELKGKKVLLVVPGLAFTKEGYRLGKGKGFYDRYIPRLKECGCELSVMGIAYREQIVESIPFDDNDIKMDKVIFLE